MKAFCRLCIRFVCLSVVTFSAAAEPAAAPQALPAIRPVTSNIIPAPPELGVSAYILIDADSGEVLAEKNADQRLPPASLTKMMTSYVLSYELASGRVKLNDMATVSEHAWAKNFPGSSLMFLQVGTQVSLDDLHRGIIISSGNDASVAVAEHLAGTEAGFADVMNQHAKMLGMANTHYMNAHGLPHPDHYTTARDLAKLAVAIIKDFPSDYALYKEKEFLYNGIKQPNRNRLLWRDQSVDGLKTGHTSEAGYCLVASAIRNGMRLVSVVMGSNGEESRMQESQSLLSHGFRYYKTHKLYSAGDVLKEVRIWGGSKETLALGVDKDVYLTIPLGRDQDVTAELLTDEITHAPVEGGTERGTVVIALPERELKRIALIAQESAESANIFARLIDEVVLFFRRLLGLSVQ
jgi:serine-type D-Ala-D-Ala carboxypeptidase (penicillin-binding protein 5/6)